MFNRALLVAFALACAYVSAARAGVPIAGTVREKGTKNPLSHINVFLISQPEASPTSDTNPSLVKKAETGDHGDFIFPDVEFGKYRWVINIAGYEKFELSADIQSANSLDLQQFYVERISYSSYETTIYSQAEKRDSKTKTLDQSQFLNIAGAGNDPVRAVQDLPGINRPPFASSQVIIEGSAPEDTNYTIDNMPVPLIFHFGGLSSVVIPEAVDHVDYLSSGFGPEFGQSIAGYVNLYTIAPQTDRIHGMAYVDTLNVGGLVQGPVGKDSSFLVGARQSYIGATLGLATKNDSSFNFTTVPDFQDFIMEYSTLLTPIDQFRLLLVGSQDTLGFLLAEPANQDPSLRGQFNNVTAFFRLIPEWTHHHSSLTTSRLWLGFGRDWISVNTSVNFYNYSNYTFSPRYELEQKLSDSWTSIVGTDSTLQWSQESFLLPVLYGAGGIPNPFSTGTDISTNQTYQANDVGVWWRNVIHPPDAPWTLIPGIRADYYNLTNEFAPQLRMAAKYALHDAWMLRGAFGMYFQAPQDQQLDPNYGNPALQSERALHLTVGAEKDFRNGAAEGWTATSDVFYKYLYDLVNNSTAYTTVNGNQVPLFYDNSGIGHAYGIEFLIKALYRNWNGWIAYTLSRSTRLFPPAPETLFQYDQTHALTAVATFELGKGWSVSSRLRYTSGDPYTPTTGGAFDSDNDVYVPLRGPYFSLRESPFFELDARVDKKWIYDKCILSLYLDIENLTNNQNTEQIIYSYNYTQQAAITGLPILPTFGLKVQF